LVLAATRLLTITMLRVTPPRIAVRSERLPAALWRMAIAAGLAFYLDAATLLSVAISLPIWRDHFSLSSGRSDCSPADWRSRSPSVH